MTLNDVVKFVVPLEVVEQTLEPLQAAGAKGYEAFVLWGGRRDQVDPTEFEFVSAYFPSQTTTRGSDGLLVVVAGESLFRANRAFYDKGLTVAAQVHSHPTDAYHSDTDDAFPLMTLTGGLSAVVPDFGKGGVDRLADWAWYRLIGPSAWASLGDDVPVVFR
jgi:hypothetical protein